MTERRKRGRPKGASRYKEQDARTIRNAALLLARGEAENRTVAFRRVGVMDESAIRRLLRGWSTDQQGEKAMAEAHERIEQERRSRNRMATSGDVRDALRTINSVTDSVRRFNRMMDLGRSPALEAMADLHKKVEQFANPPHMKALRDSMKALRINEDLTRTARLLSRGF